ncbi:MAG: bleomycin resistance protein [Chloroflexota bacterium]
MSLPIETPPLVPELYVADIDRSIAFYEAVLGFSIKFTRPEDRFAYLARNGAHIMLEEPIGRTFLADKLTHPYGRGINLMIVVTDVSELFTKVKQSGASLVLPLEDRWYRRDEVLVGNRQFVVQDPDGYLLRFYEDLGQQSIE